MRVSPWFLTLFLGAFGWSAMPPGTAAAQGHQHHGAGHAHSHAHDQAAPIGEPGKAAAASRTIEVKLVDTAFEPKAIQVKAGETVRFVLVNAGELLHEFNIGTAAMHAEHQKEMAAMAQHGMISATDIDEKGAMTHDDPNSVLVKPGEKKELVWTFAQPTTLEFACNLPGHYEAGMVGKLEFAR